MKRWWRVTSRGREGAESVEESVLAGSAEMAAVEFLKLHGATCPSLTVEVLEEDGTNGTPLPGAEVQRYRGQPRTVTVWSAAPVLPEAAGPVGARRPGRGGGW